MFFNIIHSKKAIHPDKAIVQIREMLDRTWDLSSRFQAPENSYHKEVVSTFNRYFKKLNKIVTAILKNVVNLSGLAPDLLLISQTFRKKSEEQATAISDISSSAKNMTQRLKETAAQSQEISDDAVLIEKEVQQAMQLSDGSKEQFAGIQSHVKNLVGTIGILQENSSSIASITGLIQDISDETNILSLNARIEAARNNTGSSKGFKVIAEEISSLAGQTSNAAAEIQARLDILTEKIEETVQAVNLVDQNVVSGEKMVSEACASLDSVHDRITNLSKNMGMVKESVHHQSSEVSTVTREILSIEEAVNLQNKEVEEIVTIAGSINQTCDDMILDTGIFHLSAHSKIRQQAMELAQLPDICSLDKKTQEKELRRYMDKTPCIELAYITNHHGRQITENLYASHMADRKDLAKGFDMDWSAKEWFNAPIRTDSAFISKVYRSSATRNFCFTVSVPLRKKEAVVGVLALDINFKDLLNI